MIRRTLSVVSSLVVALLLMGANSAKASEQLSVTATGVFLTETGSQMTISLSIFKSVITDASGNVTRNVLAGSAVIVGNSALGSLVINSPVVVAEYQSGWVTIRLRTYQGVDYAFSLYPRSVTNRGVIKGWTLGNTRGRPLTQDLFGRPDDNVIYPCTFITSGVSVNYRRY